MDADHQDDNGDQLKMRHDGSQQPKSSIPNDEAKAERMLKKQRTEEKMKLEEMVKSTMEVAWRNMVLSIQQFLPCELGTLSHRHAC
jgi:hypothetical protein